MFRFLGFGILFLFSLNVKSQHHCSFDELHNQDIANNPQLLAEERRIEADFEQFYQSWLSKQRADKTTLPSRYIIPVVVHVIHNNGNEKIGEPQIKSQIDALNRDFRKQPGTRGFGSGKDAQIEFALATKDPSGNPHSGINYIQSTLTNHKQADEVQLKSLVTWDQTKYLNIWTVASIDNNVLGYSRMPTTASNPNDGVVIRSGCFGTTGALIWNNRNGRTATHEIGHYLGLKHTFDPNSGCGNTTNYNCATHADGFCDTPPTLEANFGNPQRLNSCDNDNPDLPDQTRNYMDYVDDAYMDLFTERQVAKMTYTFESGIFPNRRDLFTEANQQATGVGSYGVCTAFFWSNNQYTCENAPVTFEDASLGYPSTWEWTFPGGNPATSNDRNPVVTYSTAGAYSVSLRVSNSAGASTTVSRNNFITVSGAALIPPFQETFSSSLPTGWVILNPDAASTESSKAVSWISTEGACIKFPGYSNPNYNQLEPLISPPIDMTGTQNPILQFKYAYVPYFDQVPNPTQFNDTLIIYGAGECGATLVELYKKGGSNLSSFATNPISTEFKNTTPTQWKEDSVSLKSLTNQGNLRIIFAVKNGFGNNLYLDNIQIKEGEVSFLERNLTAGSIKLYPNPLTSQTNLYLDIQKNTTFQWKVSDVAGKTVLAAKNSILLQPGKHTIQIPELLDLQQGIFLLQVSLSGETATIKINLE